MIQKTRFSPEIPDSYFLLTRNNRCAALLLAFFHAAPDQEIHDYFTFTLSTLQQCLSERFSLSAIAAALSLLQEDAYLFLTSYSNLDDKPNIDLASIGDTWPLVSTKSPIKSKEHKPLTFFLDRPKVSLFNQVSETLLTSLDEQKRLNKHLQLHHPKEYSKVASHCSDARDGDLPATLQLFQWLATVEYFHWKCAYCATQDYRILEHFIPVLAHQGGTTWSNCVPACQRCNTTKGPLHPSLVSQLSSNRVRHYLQTIQHIEETIQKREQEQRIQNQQAALKKINALDRLIITTLQFDHSLRQFFFSVKLTRLIGWICGIFLCGIIAAPWWLALDFAQTHNDMLIVSWVIALLVCVGSLYYAIATVHPIVRQKMESQNTASKQATKDIVNTLLHITTQNQEEIQALEKKVQQARMRKPDIHVVQRRILAKVQKTLETGEWEDLS